MFDSVQKLRRIFQNIGHRGIKLPKKLNFNHQAARIEKSFAELTKKCRGLPPCGEGLIQNWVQGTWKDYLWSVA